MTQPACRTFLPGHVVVIICSITIQLSNLARTIYLEQHKQFYSKISNFAIMGLLFLSYPLLGYIADVCLTRYRTLKCSFIFLIVGYTIGLILFLIAIPVNLTEILDKTSFFNDDKSYTVLVISAIPLIALVTTGVGMFEANALQFGLDQLLEAPTPKLIAFIHWYYWTHNAVQLVAMSLAVAWLTTEASLKSLSSYEAHTIRHTLYFTGTATLVLAAVGSLVLLHKSKRHLYILKAGLNPFKNIYRVLKYSWNHKVPEHRSAFTYWEEDIPRRIDLGKNKYGGHLSYLSILALLCLWIPDNCRRLAR